MLGLENHWGLGRTADGVLKIVETIKSPWLQITLDTGNFLENSYEQMEKMASALGSAGARSGQNLLRRRPLVRARPRLHIGSPAFCASIITAAGSRWNSKETRMPRPACRRAWRC